jgi:flagellin-like hook-associated protein FlgL
MPKANQAKKRRVATASEKRKSSMETLMGSMEELAAAAAKGKSAEEIRAIRKDINEIVDHAVAAGRQRRRETA